MVYLSTNCVSPTEWPKQSAPSAVALIMNGTFSRLRAILEVLWIEENTHMSFLEDDIDIVTEMNT